MKFLTAASLLLSTALAAPVQSDSDSSTTYEIIDFSKISLQPSPLLARQPTPTDLSPPAERKYNGVDTASLSFNITATNTGTLNFLCIPYDPAIQGATEAFESGRVYACGSNSFFSFSFEPDTSDLFLWQDVTETEILGGGATVPTRICRAGGSSPQDLICSVPFGEGVDVTLSKLGE